MLHHRAHQNVLSITLLYERPTGDIAGFPDFLIYCYFGHCQFERTSDFIFFVKARGGRDEKERKDLSQKEALYSWFSWSGFK